MSVVSVDVDKTHKLFFSRGLRKSSSDAERLLWWHLRAHRFLGLKFRRQHPIGPFVVDFACLGRRLLIELDGGQHAESGGYDAERTRWLERQGYRVLRFWNNDVQANLKGVLQSIATALNDPSP